MTGCLCGLEKQQSSASAKSSDAMRTGDSHNKANRSYSGATLPSTNTRRSPCNDHHVT